MSTKIYYKSEVMNVINKAFVSVTLGITDSTSNNYGEKLAALEGMQRFLMEIDEQLKEED